VYRVVLRVRKRDEVGDKSRMEWRVREREKGEWGEQNTKKENIP